MANWIYKHPLETIAIGIIIGIAIGLMLPI